MGIPRQFERTTGLASSVFEVAPSAGYTGDRVPIRLVTWVIRPRECPRPPGLGASRIDSETERILVWPDSFLTNGCREIDRQPSLACITDRDGAERLVSL